MKLVHIAHLDSSGYIPTSRRRVVLVYVRREDEVPAMLYGIMHRLRLPLLERTTVRNCDSIFQSFGSASELEQLLPTDREIERLTDPALLPDKTIECGDALRVRTSSVGPIMASYRKAAALDREFLQDKSLLKELVITPQFVRFMHPAEIAYPAWIGDRMLCLPIDHEISYRLLGNSFIPLQAAITFSWMSCLLRVQSELPDQCIVGNIVRAFNGAVIRASSRLCCHCRENNA